MYLYVFSLIYDIGIPSISVFKNPKIEHQR